MLLQIYPDMFTKSVDRFHRSIIFSGFAEIRKGLYSEKAAETAVFPDTEKTI